MTRPYLVAGSLIAALVAAAALVLARTHRHTNAGPPAPAPAPVLGALAFQTTYPPGWSLTTQAQPRGAVRYQLSSNGVAVGALDIPQPGGVAITITEAPASLLVGPHAAHPAGTAPLQLLPGAVSVPTGATAVARTSEHAAVLGGVEAGEETYVYIYENHANVQDDLLAVHGHKSVLVELDAEPTLAPEGQAGLALITGHWAWR